MARRLHALLFISSFDSTCYKQAFGANRFAGESTRSNVYLRDVKREKCESTADAYAEFIINNENLYSPGGI